MTRRYEGPRPITQGEAEEIFRDGTSEEIAQALVDIAHSDVDRAWVQERCFELLRASDWRLWGISAICLGHLLRSGFSIDLETSIPLIDAARCDERVRGQANDALGDIRQLHPALAHQRDVRARARLAQALRQWLRRARGLTAEGLWTLLADSDLALAKHLDPIEGREPSPEERSEIDVEAKALLARIETRVDAPITLFGDELDAFRALLDREAMDDDVLEIERSLAVLGYVTPAANVLLDEANRGGEISRERLVSLLAVLDSLR